MKKIISIGLNIVFWTICACVIFMIFSPVNREVEIVDGIETVTIEYDTMAIYGSSIGILIKMILYYFNVCFLSRFIDQKAFGKYIIFLLLSTSVAFLVDYLKFGFIYGFNFFMFETFLVNIWLYIFFVGTSFVHLMVLRWQKEEALKQRLKEDRLAAELKLLKSQINPHFLFNALNNMLSIAEKHQQTEVSSSIAQLSEMLRFLLYATGDDLISVEKEVHFIESYIQLNRLRFDEKDPIDIRFTVDPTVLDKTIAPTVFIPLVENAFKHGISIYEPSFIHISLHLEASELIFECRNSIVAKSKNDTFTKEDSGVGLQNVKRRLAILYPNKHSLTIKEEQNTYEVILKLNT
ncbi:sensor histidine kinase [uncultured Kordia sp.]|uniref:sensor histidine kinase n=1 Tax=uncultured Kordia sp. TaxID=507699 RepID=UPI002614D09B|nr:histidine kinase [uncultured Kordia sp.]